MSSSMLKIRGFHAGLLNVTDGPVYGNNAVSVPNLVQLGARTVFGRGSHLPQGGIPLYSEVGYEQKNKMVVSRHVVLNRVFVWLRATPVCGLLAALPHTRAAF